MAPVIGQHTDLPGFHVTIEGAKQGKFKGAPHADKIRGVAFHYELIVPRDAATGQASGNRQHGPVTFVKKWDASSPQLFQAATTNERLNSVLFEFYGDDGKGEVVVLHTMKLTAAAISAIKHYVDSPSVHGQGAIQEFVESPSVHGQGAIQEFEEVTLTFRKIEMTDHNGGTSATDVWSSGTSRTANSTPAVGVRSPNSGLVNATGS